LQDVTPELEDEVPQGPDLGADPEDDLIAQIRV
jgi:hypothetical protein